jgi:two-component system, chemotaxis family, CheB/CheR fusion protein
MKGIDIKNKVAGKNSGFPIVAIGASAGGLEAMTNLLKSLPENTGFAYVYIQHLDPNHESMLTDILGRATKMAGAGSKG